MQIQALPHHVFSFKKNEVLEIGAIWFIVKLEGYRKDELGMFADLLYRYLKINFSKDYIVNPNYCLAIDTANCNAIDYSQIQRKEIPDVLPSTLSEIKKMM